MAEDRRRPPKFSTETRKSDPRRTNDENFASFMGFLDERFYDVDRHACRVKKGVRSYTYSLHLVRCGVARLAAFETDAMTLRYSIRKNRYHSFIKLMMPTSGTFTITVNGVRTVRLAPGEALLFDPTEDITYAAVKDTKGISLLVASNYFHARTRFQAALFKVLPILGKTARERCFLAVLRAARLPRRHDTGRGRGLLRYALRCPPPRALRKLLGERQIFRVASGFPPRLRG